MRVYKRGQSWYLDYSHGHERIRRKATGTTRREAMEELHAIISQSGSVSSANAVLRDIYDAWTNQLVNTYASPRTAIRYRQRLKLFLDHCEAVTVAELTTQSISAVMQKIVASGRTPQEANAAADKLKAALSWAKTIGMIPENPIKEIIKLKSVRRKYRRDLQSDESQELLALPSNYRPIWAFLLYTGCRRGEMENLRWVDLDFKQMVVKITPRVGWEPKTSSGARAIPMHPELAAILKSISKQSQYVFVTKTGEPRHNNILRAFRSDMKKVLKKLNPEMNQEQLNKELKIVDIHSLRYTFITELVAAGVDPKTVQAIAGHKSINTTLGIYAQCRPAMAQNAILQLPWNFMAQSWHKKELS